MRVIYLIEKEFKEFRRNSFLPRLAILFPIMIMLIMPWVATLDIQGLSVAVVDRDCSSLSLRLRDKISASVYFKLVAASDNYDEALQEMQSGIAHLLLTSTLDFSTKIGQADKC